ncbi:MAG: polyphosphate kinase 1 [Gemmatimonadota bacterium]|nr:MAG: polyphosphate kinase 1 [Gemmatimonadota bacterium]
MSEGAREIDVVVAATSADESGTASVSVEALHPDRPRSPADLTPMPVPGPDGDFDLDAPELLLNRELTWLNFNFRVLHESVDPRTPLLERVKFVSIVCSNLDEFFMKRIGGLKQQVGARVQELTVDGRTPRQQIEESYALVRELDARARESFEELQRLMAAEGIVLTTFEQVSLQAQLQLREHYVVNIYPLVTPQSTDPAHPFPFVSNLSLNLLVTLRHPGEPSQVLARVKVPMGAGIPRLLKIPGENTFVTLESVMANTLDHLFPGMEIVNCELFRVTRNANTERDEEDADDLMAMIESELRDRRFAPIVRLQVGRGMSEYHRGMLAAELGLDEEEDVFDVDGFLGMADLMELYRVEAPHLKDPVHHPPDHPLLATDRSIFHVLRTAGSLLVHHPYQSYVSSVEQFLKEASVDPKVRAIKMTLYRTSQDSMAVGHLMEAARNGKQVAVVLELKARFDEEANIRWANRLGSAGIHVTYGVVGLKTHCKVILVVRQDYDGLRRYSHVGTGNYHAGTARGYADLGLLTCDEGVGSDLTELFNYLTTGYKPKRNYQKLMVSPKGMKRTIIKYIQREMALHREGAGGLIQLKLNGLEDAEVTRALYAAAKEGVKIDLIVRDTCRLRPGIPGLSENVTVCSVVGRFLEHSRIYYFRNGGEDEYYFGSADCMTRNLESRVEALVPVEAAELKDELRRVFDLLLADRRGGWDMGADGSYVLRSSVDEEVASSQDEMIEWGEALYKEATRLKRRRAKGLVEDDLASGGVTPKRPSTHPG